MTMRHIFAQFTASRAGVDGLTVTWSVDRVTRANGTRSALVTDAATSVTYGRFGLYGYLLDMELDTYDYLVTAKTTSPIVDMKELTSFWTSTEAEDLAAISTYLSVFVAKSSEIDSLPTAAEIDAQLSGTHGAGTWGNSTGGGAVATTVTVTVSSLPRDGVEVWVTTDSDGLNLVASGVTDTLGEVDFMLDAGTYYVWKQLAGVNFTNPQTMVVS